MKKSDAFSSMKDLIYITGDKLINTAKSYSDLNPRDTLKEIDEYIQDKTQGRILELFGLRRTGKTTLIFQEIQLLLDRGIDPNSIIYINGSSDNSIFQVIKFLNNNLQFKYVFIDEITYLADFVAGSNVLCDMQYMIKTVVTGTDSLSFLLASSLMFDRYVKVSTTFISYNEWVKLYNGKTDIFDYIHNAGILGGYEDSDSYINKSINTNIQNSLEKGLYYSSDKYLYGNIRDLIDVYPRLITKITEDCTNRFTKQAIKSTFTSMMSMGFNEHTKILSSKEKYLIDSTISKNLNLDFKSMDIDKNDIDTLVELLNELDFYKKFTIINSDSHNKKVEYKELQVQSAIRYGQFMQFLDILKTELSLLGIPSEDFVKEFLPNLEGHLIEQAVQLHVLYKASKDWLVFTYKNTVINAEIDLILVNKNTLDSYLIEIKRSFKRKSKYYRWLVDKDVMNDLNINFGIRKEPKKIILYNGDSIKIDSIEYINIEEFLLKKLDDILNK